MQLTSALDAWARRCVHTSPRPARHGSRHVRSVASRRARIL